METTPKPRYAAMAEASARVAYRFYVPTGRPVILPGPQAPVVHATESTKTKKR